MACEINDDQLLHGLRRYCLPTDEDQGRRGGRRPMYN